MAPYQGELASAPAVPFGSLPLVTLQGCTTLHNNLLRGASGGVGRWLEVAGGCPNLGTVHPSERCNLCQFGLPRVCPVDISANKVRANTFSLSLFSFFFFVGFSLLYRNDIMLGIKQCAISWSKQRDIHREGAYAGETLGPVTGLPSKCGSDLGSETVPLGKECSVPFHHNSLPRSSPRPCSFLSLSIFSLSLISTITI